jgi:hypothetical protein
LVKILREAGKAPVEEVAKKHGASAFGQLGAAHLPKDALSPPRMISMKGTLIS